MESGRLTVSLTWARMSKPLLLTFCLTLLIRGEPGWAEELSGDALLRSRCAMCHATQEGGKLDSIESGRRTPEGWEMTIDRMIRMHGVRLQPDEGQALVKYLSDQYGLAPSEIEPYRYALEKRNSTIVQSDLPKVVQGACLSCHSYARIALQRRTVEAWQQMADTKLALFTNTENVTASSGMLNTFWYDDARKDVRYFTSG